MSMSFVSIDTWYKTPLLTTRTNLPSWSRAWIIISVLLILLGTGLRLQLYFSELPFRIDEIRLAMNISERSYTDLLAPLSYGQSAPIGFLFAIKIITDLAGHSELIYRVLSIFCSIIGLFLLGFITLRYLHPFGSIIVLALVNLSPSLIQRSADFKQYSSDFLMTLIMLVVALPWLKGSKTLCRWIVLTCVGSICLWFSHSGAFVVGAVGLIWLFELVATRDIPGIKRILLTLVIWVLFLLSAFWLNMRYSSNQAHLQTYWHKYFMPMDTIFSRIRWMMVSIPRISNVLNFGQIVSVVISIFAFIGQISLLIRDWKMGLAILLIIVLPFTSAILNIYPFGQRMIIFLLPAFLLLAAEGINSLPILSTLSRKVFAVMGIIYLLTVSVQDFHSLSWSGGRYDMPDALKYLNVHISKGDKVIIEQELKFPYTFYKRQFPTLFSPHFVSIPIGERFPYEDFRQLGSTEKFWLVVPNNIWEKENTYKYGYHIEIRRMIDSIGYLKVTDVVNLRNLTIYSVEGLVNDRSPPN